MENRYEETAAQTASKTAGAKHDLSGSEAELSETNAAGAEAAATPQVATQAPAHKRIAELFERMARQRHLLLAILDYCTEPKTLDELRAHVGHLQETHRSVFSLDNVCGQLEGAGALARVLENGAPYSCGNEAPTIEVVNGVECLRPAEPPQAYWLATDAGRAALAEHDPAGKLARLLQNEAAYQPIYERVLTLCATEGGATMAELGAAIDNDPLVQQPRFYAARFVNNLEACDAVSWGPNWVTTEIGLKGLEMLAHETLPTAAGNAMA